MPPRIHLGINTCFAVKRWPEPEQWARLITDELGLDCCQVSLDLVDPLFDESAQTEYAARVRRASTDRQLTIHSTCTGLAAYSWSQLLHPEAAMRDAAMRWYERAITFTAQLAARGTGGHIGAFSAADYASDERKRLLLDELRQRLQVLSHSAARQGLEFLLFENMAVEREWGHTIEEAHWLSGIEMGNGVPLVLCLDIGHPCPLRTGTASDDYVAWLREPWRTPPIMHLQQTDRSGDHHWPFTDQYNRRGVVRADQVVEALERWPEYHEVFLFLEPIHPFEADDATVLSELRDSVRHWQQALAAR